MLGLAYNLDSHSHYRHGANDDRQFHKWGAHVLLVHAEIASATARQVNLKLKKLPMTFSFKNNAPNVVIMIGAKYGSDS